MNNAVRNRRNKIIKQLNLLEKGHSGDCPHKKSKCMCGADFHNEKIEIIKRSLEYIVQCAIENTNGSLQNL